MWEWSCSLISLHVKTIASKDLSKHWKSWHFSCLNLAEYKLIIDCYLEGTSLEQAALNIVTQEESTNAELNFVVAHEFHSGWCWCLN